MVQAESSELVADPRFLPAPHTAAEKAAIEAALLASSAPRRAIKTRVLMSTAALALAVTVPNLSLGAMGSPFFDAVDDPAPLAKAPAVVRTPALPRAASIARRPYIPVARPGDVAAATATYSSRSNFGEFDREAPLAFRTVAERLDLASAPVEMPIAATASVSAALRDQPVSLSEDGDRRAFTNFVFIEQITDRPLVARLAPASAREVQVTVGAGTPVERSEVISDATFAAIFAGTFEGEPGRDAPPAAPVPAPPAPQRDTVSQVAPLPVRPARVSANAAAQAALAIDLKIDGQPEAPVFVPAFPISNPVSVATAQASARSRATLAADVSDAPIAVVASGQDVFDLAFEPFEPVSLAAVAPSARLPQAPVQRIGATTPARNAHLVDVEQISGRPLIARVAPQEAREVRATLNAESAVMRSDAISNELVETAFAGVLGASRDVRGSLPLDRGPQPSPDRLPEPVRAAIARAVPIPEPDPGLGTSAAAQVALVPKSELDARVNGVLTGTVDFRQLDGTIAIRLRSVVNMLRDRFSSTEFSALLHGDAIDTFVPIAQLQATGVPITYNPAYDEVEFGIDYQDAPNAKKVQMEQIGVPSIGQERAMIEQIPRR